MSHENYRFYPAMTTEPSDLEERRRQETTLKEAVKSTLNERYKYLGQRKAKQFFTWEQYQGNDGITYEVRISPTRIVLYGADLKHSPMNPPVDLVSRQYADHLDGSKRLLKESPADLTKEWGEYHFKKKTTVIDLVEPGVVDAAAVQTLDSLLAKN